MHQSDFKPKLALKHRTWSQISQGAEVVNTRKGGKARTKKKCNAVKVDAISSKIRDKAQRGKTAAVPAYLNLWGVQGQIEGEKMLSWATAYLL